MWSLKMDISHSFISMIQIWKDFLHSQSTNLYSNWILNVDIIKWKGLLKKSMKNKTNDVK